MKERLKHLYKSQQLTKEIISDIFKDAKRFYDENYEPELKGNILATLFYEPSTRTRLSFESAMLRLGGSVLSTENAKEFSSAIKGETIEDTIRVVENYCDAIVIRHYQEGTAERAAELSSVPIINAGDGRGQHPTQALLDIYTINDEIGRLNKLNVVMVGDLANGRTVRSLCYLLSKYSGNKITFVSPENLRMGDDIKEHLKENEVEFEEKSDLNKVMPDADIVYMTRIQKERMPFEEYEKSRGRYIITEDNLKLLDKKSRILHPLPKVDEIDLPISVENNDKRIAYFRQAENGLYVRMALLNHLLG
jgi:aspartate carbamoyltransferase catalytic subunit